jgi:peroxiredoxin/tetratricopeptide (TPR) repeat protein
MIHRLLALVALLAAAPALRAQTGPDPGHSLHGEVFDEGPRQGAVLMGGTGRVHFPVTTRSAAAQKFFNQGVGQLHGFWFFESERSFRQAARHDTNCAMAYWGMAMSNLKNQKRARDFIRLAMDKRAHVSPREQMWIDALAKFLADDQRPKKDRDSEFIRSLIAIVEWHPDDLEAKAFVAWQMWELKVKEKPYETNDKLDALIGQVLAAEPMHPAHHYRIHVWDSANDPRRALESAARCGPAAPAIAHMWHMPGHTYSKLKRYADAAWQQEASARVDHAHMMRYLVLPDQIHNYAHNNEWLIRDLNHLGRVEQAIGLARNLIELPQHPKWNTLDKPRGSASYGRTRLLETLVRWELWDQLVALETTPYLPPSTNAVLEAPRLRALGLAHDALGHQPALQRQIQALAALEATLPKRPTARATNAPTGSAKAPAKSAATPAPKTAPKQSAATGSETNAPSPSVAVANALAELRALAALAAGNRTEATNQLARAKDIPKERLARHYLRLGDKSKAEQFARDAVKGAENQVQPLANLIEVLHALGKTADAKKEFEKLRPIAAHADPNAPILARLTLLAPRLGLPVAWRPDPVPAKDIGARPPLDTLGPLHWTPPAAPAWTLPAADGRSISLADYRGRPVIVIFYLGHGCLHCIQQLDAFAPLADEFRAAGIELVAVSKDSPAGLKLSLDKLGQGRSFPIPLVSDEKLRVFKRYRCYDDFEQTALHGTFLIDGAGAIRWLDISYQPFMETKFLLQEARRLLGLPNARLSDTGLRRLAQR